MRAVLLLYAIFALVIPTAQARQNGAPLPAPAPQPAATPRPDDGASNRKQAESINTEVMAARAATSQKRFADAESLMLTATSEHPNLILPWVELGLAQLGLKKYPEAENSFKVALGEDDASLKRAHANDFYQKQDAPGVVAPSATRASRNTAGGGFATNGESRTPDVLGVSYASLGEVYAHQSKAADAQAAFDSAVKAYPVNTATYRHNEAVAFFQAGNADAQLAAANQAIALAPTRADNYYFKAQALVSKATIDAKTQKMVLPEGCADAYQKYLELDAAGPFSADAKGVLAGAGITPKAGKK